MENRTKLKAVVAGSPTENGMLLEEFIQKIITLNKFDHPVEAIQFVLQHLCAVASAVGVPPMVIVETALEAAMAGLTVDLDEIKETAQMRSVNGKLGVKETKTPKPH
jgi:hypothetical protein